MPLVTVFEGHEEEQKAARLDPNVPRVYEGIPPMRGEMFQPDSEDGNRVDYQKRLWGSQNDLLRGRDRQVEENVRMLCGQHWTVYNEILGRHIDITRYLTDEEKRWRQLPVMNRLMLWFMLLHARMTENPPIITFQPATSDRSDAELAEVMDTVWKTLWHQADMSEVIDDLVAWLIPGGRAFLKSRIDPNMGDLIPLQAPGMVDLVGPDGNPIPQPPGMLSLVGPDGAEILGADGTPIRRYLDAAPYGIDGEPLRATMDSTGRVTFPSPAMIREGGITVDVLSPLEARGQWGPTKWHKKGWHIHRTYATPEEVFNNFGVELDPEVMGDEAEAIHELTRLHFGSGYFGAAGGKNEVVSTGVDRVRAGKDGFVEIFEGWYAPSDAPGMQRTMDSPGGRLLITTRSKCLRDGPRYAPFPHTSPIHAVDFVNLKGRPQGTSPQEMMNGPARSRNRMYSQVFQHTALVANPIKMIDSSTGLNPGDVPNKPGAEVFGTFNGSNGDPIRYTRPPDLSADVYKVLDLLTQEFDDLGSVPGAEGRAPTADASGELVKELRFNSDRFVSATSRRMVVVISRVAADWQVMLPLVWTEEKLLKVGGDENVAQTIMVTPELFHTGKINIVPDLESMLPEGRGEKQNRYWGWYQGGVFGDPASPVASQLYLDLAKFPHLNREALPGGVDRSTASRENGQILMGASMIPVLEWYDHAVHLDVHYRFMKSQHYLKLPIPVQEVFVRHTQEHQMVLEHQMMQQALKEAALQAQMQGMMPEEQGKPKPGGGGDGPPAGAAA